MTLSFVDREKYRQMGDQKVCCEADGWSAKIWSLYWRLDNAAQLNTAGESGASLSAGRQVEGYFIQNTRRLLVDVLMIM